MVNEKSKGTVTYINKKRNYGVIHSDSDTHVFFSERNMKNINEGDLVEFFLKPSDVIKTKTIAFNITKLKEK